MAPKQSRSTNSPKPAPGKQPVAAKKSVKAVSPVKKNPVKPAKQKPEPPAYNTPKASAGTKILSSKVVYQGKVFSVTQDKVVEPGSVSATRDVVRHSGSVVVLAIGSQRDAATGEPQPTVLLEKQYRHAAGKYLLELPAGRIEPGEAPLAAAKRELIEETGFKAKRWTKLVRYYASPGFLAEHMQVFLAEDIQEGTAQPEEDERIELIHMPLKELLLQIQAGKLEDAKTILSVLLYASKQESV